LSQSAHCNDRRSPRRGRIVFSALVFAALGWILASTPVWAHMVTILGWVEGDRVYTRSTFSGGQSVIDSLVVVYDDQGNELLEGKTDEEGGFSFKVPKRSDLKIVLKAPMGHMAEYKMAASELIGEARASETGSPEVEAVASSHDSPPPEVPATATVALTREEFHALIDESLDRKLAPIFSLLAQQAGRGPRVSEVIGGVGYILGLVGVALYVVSRGRKGL